MQRTKDNDAPLRIAGGQMIDARRAALSAWGPHRLEAVASVGDVLYVNDSRATFLDATLESLGTIDRRAVWIVGGWSQEMSGEAVQSMLRERVHAVVLFGALAEGSEESLPTHVYRTDDLRTAVFTARELAEPGDLVLFSPACPSGNGFANYEERGAEFRRAVRDL
jgi:UDP-N-acetylmuramoylalanine--D-glutamate ligase